MQRRRIAVAAAVVAAAGAAVAFTLPSMAGTTSSATKPASTTKSGVAPQILAAMQRDLGLDGDQATARLKRAKWASGVSATLAAKTGSDFGGAWLATDGTTLKVAVTNADAAAAVRAAGAVPVLVKRSEQTLDAAKAKLDAVRADAAGLSGWYVDVPTNKLVVVAKPGRTAAARSLAAEAGVKRDAVTVVTSSATPKPLAGVDLHGADPYFITVAEGTARCSIGFAVQGGFVTAGHCGAPGDPTFDQKQQPMGSVKASIFPGDNDEGFVQVTNGDALQPFVNDFKGNLLPVAGSTEAPVGAAVCRSGSTSGTHCGTILAKNQTVVYPEGAVTGLTRTNACAEGGDSGGPWLAGDQAQGVTSGGSGDCTTGGETFFQPVNEILAINNLTLLTTGGGDAGTPPSQAATAPPTDSANACADLPVQAQGSLSRAGQAQSIPGNGAFRANAGRQVACLDAPDGADFDLFLQRLTGTGFRTVAKATGDGDKTLSANLRSGIYRYVVVADSGSGAYTLGFATP
ncbi:S1 family peptidase [Actinoplanes sp. KI2]|uniref:S1 family peptidase n=1 Tax=Actinoplanes sp. KI2 TaxID=2983315 RepID=UPI0021D57807|nr:S1 family peptidase [Actinoplanes sp. KI2]MCU7723780.1 S1 family peptidase [Actinoplanes sp. KI2]